MSDGTVRKELPPWLTSEFLVTVLQEGDASCDVEVLKFSAKLAVPPGSNFTSHIYRVQVEYTLNAGPVSNISLMIKAPITTGLMSEMEGHSDPFEAEPKVYGDLLPRLKKKINCDFGPKSFPCPMRGMVLQDLREGGFVVCDRLEQLDFRHCEMALNLLAKFHAASVACYHDDPEFIRAIGKERFYTEESVGFLQNWLLDSTKNISDIIIDKEECKHTANYILKTAGNLLNSAIELCKPTEGSLNVLNHGDFWMTNILYKHDNRGKAVDVKFIDFQVVRFASPVLDLFFFLYTSANPEARSRQKELFRGYLNIFNSSLEVLGCEERLTPDEFDQEMKRCMNWAVIAICNVLPIVLCDPDKVIDSESFSEDDREKNLAVYKSKKLIETLPSVAKCFQDLFFSGDKILSP